MTNDLQIYLLDPQQYTPETIAVAFAKTSRSPESFRQIAAELNEQKSADFNEKWVVGYGHSSVAEHAVLHIAVENISRLATECLESNRLASYTEKSTRYQTWDASAFFVPDEMSNSLLKEEYIGTCRMLLKAYQHFLPLVSKELENANPRGENESTPAYERRIRSMTTDVCRFLLPSSILANVGMTINARALEHAITKMLSHPLREVQEIGARIKDCAKAQVPTLLKYADADDYLQNIPAPFEISGLSESSKPDWCKLIHFDPEAENRILAACLYRFNNIAYAQSLEWIKKAPDSEKARFLEALLTSKNRHSVPLRELEHANFTFDVTLDQGAYYEVKRHRMMTLTAQPLGVSLGYAVPKGIEKAGLLQDFDECMKNVTLLFEKIYPAHRDAASYIVPNAFNRRFLMTANLRSLIHFTKLRSAPNAHFSVRRLAQQITAELRNALPVFSPFLEFCPNEDAAQIESRYFASTQRRNL